MSDVKIDRPGPSKQVPAMLDVLTRDVIRRICMS